MFQHGERAGRPGALKAVRAVSPVDLVEDEKALLALAVLGGDLPPQAEECLSRAGELYAESDKAERLLRQAERFAPDHAAVLIGFYRFYFYKGRLIEALAIAERCLVKACRDNNLSNDWRQVTPGRVAFGCYEDPLARFFMFTLKGYAYLQMRLGALEESRIAVAKLLELDPTDKIGARVLVDVLNRHGDEDA